MTSKNLSTWRPAEAISVCQPPSLSNGGYLLLDPGALPDAGQLPSLNARACVPTNWSKDLVGLPVLLDLDQCEADQTEWLTSILSGEHEMQPCVPLARPRVCALLRSSLSMDAIVLRLSQQMLVLPSDESGNRAGRGALWRFFDPRVFANLCWLLDPDQLATLSHPVSTWIFPWFGNWFELNLPTGVPVPDIKTKERVAGFSPINIEVWERAQRIALINQVLARLALPLDLPWWQRASLAMRIEVALVMARDRLRWDQSEDQMRYAEHVMRCGPEFLNHPKLAPYWMLRDKEKTSGGWKDLVALLTALEYDVLEKWPLDISQVLAPAEISNIGTLEMRHP
jgi:Domain of unknown function (DUF4123)